MSSRASSAWSPAHATCLGARGDLLAGLTCVGLRAAERAALMGLRPRVRVEHRVVAIVHLVPDCAFPSPNAALPPAAIEEPVLRTPVEVPPVPTVEAGVPPAAPEPPLPPVMLVCASAASVRRRAKFDRRRVASTFSSLEFLLLRATMSRSCSRDGDGARAGRTGRRPSRTNSTRCRRRPGRARTIRRPSCGSTAPLAQVAPLVPQPAEPRGDAAIGPRFDGHRAGLPGRVLAGLRDGFRRRGAPKQVTAAIATIDLFIGQYLLEERRKERPRCCPAGRGSSVLSVFIRPCCGRALPCRCRRLTGRGASGSHRRAALAVAR